MKPGAPGRIRPRGPLLGRWPAMGAVKASLLWPGIALAILTVIGLFGGLGLEYLPGRKR
jgi:hypothetical protein